METDIPKKELSTEDRLRAEVENLKRQLDEQKRSQAKAPPSAPQPAQPSRMTLGALSLVGVVAVLVAFFVGYLPHRRREAMLISEANAQHEAVPVVTVVQVVQSTGSVSLKLPGSIQAVTETPVLSRSNGYVRKRFVDIGDRVAVGQLLAELEAPELEQLLVQGRAELQQARSALEQTSASLEQGKANEELARVTAQRWARLVTKGAVSRQENDNYQAQYQSQVANVKALEKAVAAARNNVSASGANVARLSELRGFKMVRAPFAGVITLRNVDVGTLITAANTLMFRIAQTNILRTFLNVPQTESGAVRVGQAARITVPDLPGRQFTGTVTRTSNALDPATRTLLVEVQVPNQRSILLPGMYGQVDLTTPRKDPPLLIPGDTLVVRPDGTQVALVTPDQTIHFQHIELGRDYGDRIEVISGLQLGQRVVVNPGDTVREGAKVKPALLNEKPGASVAPAGASR
ncbi:MAG: efflux RND transporter periplasmic adaptor subunit [Acidobacteria bacterium]|nr:MAG: efflux RND transporter periplasmic adaptor subunit [Acidobacteriota bacterium]